MEVDGSLISAMLTAYVLDKQLESWKELLEAEEEGEDGGKEERDEMEAVFGDRRFWDALALRYRARLGLDVPVTEQEEREDRDGGTRMGEWISRVLFIDSALISFCCDRRMKRCNAGTST